MLFRSPSKLGPNTLQGACSLAQRIRVTQTPENIRALDALREHHKFVESSTPYKDVLLAEQLAMPPPASSSLKIVEIDGDEQIPPYMGPVPFYNKKRKPHLIMKVGLPVMNDSKGKAKADTPPSIDISDIEDEALDWGKDHSDEEFELNKTSDVNSMRDLTPMAWERKDKHYNAYYNGITPSVFSSFDQNGTDSLSNQGWLPHGLDSSVCSSICINARVTVDTPVCNIICECLSSNCVECKKWHNKSSIKTNEIVFIADSGASGMT